MKYLLWCFGANVVPVTCVIVAGVLADEGREWWVIPFLALALLTTTALTIRESESKKTEP